MLCLGWQIKEILIIALTRLESRGTSGLYRVPPSNAFLNDCLGKMVQMDSVRLDRSVGTSSDRSYAGEWPCLSILWR